MNTVVTKKRCAVYTRVSTDERLDQSFNSLDAQREAGQAYIVSQRAEGWMATAISVTRSIRQSPKPRPRSI
jgi:DNA invertase Pin-like site-specific DNA recombinase